MKKEEHDIMDLKLTLEEAQKKALELMFKGYH